MEEYRNAINVINKELNDLDKENEKVAQNFTQEQINEVERKYFDES